MGSGAKGGAAATGITAASETLRTVAAVTNALTNTAGVTASIGFSKSKSTTASQESAVVGSTITGGTVNVTATGTDVRVIGSSISSLGDTNLNAARDVILESAQSTIATQSKSSSVGGGLSFTVALGVTGIRGTPSAGISGSKSSASSNEVTQANTNVTAGGTLNLTTGRDATLKGAVAEGKNVVATIGRDLSIESLQDTSTAKSKSIGGSLSISGKSLNGKGLADAVGIGRTGLADNATADSDSGTVGSAGVSGSVSFGKPNASSNIVETQSALIASGGSLNATITGNTGLKGGVIAALDADDKDTGRLALTTGTLTASDIKDSAKSKSIGIGVSANINDPLKEGVKGAGTPTVDASFASSTFKQDTKATIGQGTLTVGVPDSNVTINRDVEAAQVVTKNNSFGFTAYIDEAAIREVVALARGDKANSTILNAVGQIKADFDGNKDTTSNLAGEVQQVQRRLALTAELNRIDREVDAGGSAEDAFKLRTDAVGKFNGLTDEQLADPKIREPLELVVAQGETARLRDKADGRKLTGGERERTAFVRDNFAPPKPAQGEGNTPEGTEIVVIGNLIGALDKSLLNAADTTLVGRASELIRPIPKVGEVAGGTVKGTGTGLLNQAKDTAQLVTDAGGKLLNLATFGTAFKAQAARTNGRIDGALALGAALRKDPVGTGIKLGEGFVTPFTKARDQLAAGQTFEGTATATEAGADLIVKAATGGSKFIAGILINGGKLPNLPDATPGNPNLGDLKGGDPFTPPVVPLDRSKISTAKPGQSAVPRDLEEQLFFDSVKADPAGGQKLPGLNKDTRFLAADGFEKRQSTKILGDGSKIVIHYQLDTKTGIPYDVKIVSPKRPNGKK